MSLGEVTLEVEGSPFAPVSVLNQMRREAVERLQALQSAASRGMTSMTGSRVRVLRRRGARAAEGEANCICWCERRSSLRLRLSCGRPA